VEKIPEIFEERLVRGPSIESACAQLEGWARGVRYPSPLLLVGEQGVGKRFLLRWAQNLALRFQEEGKGRPRLPLPLIHEGVPNPPPPGYLILHVHPPEYERRLGVLLEWARVRGIRFEEPALHLLLRLNTYNLERLRGMMARVVLESGGKRTITETDTLRTLERAGLLAEVLPEPLP
jgi:chromosomal replication initiation ATPase DnaA